VTGGTPSPGTLSPPPSAPSSVTGFRRLLTWKAWAPVVYGIAGTVGGILFLLELGYLGVYRLSFALSQINPLLSGFYTSLEVVAVILPLGFGLGFLIGWARTSRSLILRGLGSVYVDFFRSMPPIALIAFFYLIGALELKGSSLNPYQVFNTAQWLGVLALALHTAAYQAEIVRAGILSVPAGQTEASDAVGISRMRSMFVVVLPQAFRVSLPALGNEFSSSIKDTSLLSVIGWHELSGVALIQSSFAYTVYLYGSLVIWIEAAFLYFVLTYLVTRTVRGVEDLFKVPGLEAARL
jgi:His/Glu/Gln/Arg/opine family amino acid ABC transporter permease subunit